MVELKASKLLERVRERKKEYLGIKKENQFSSNISMVGMMMDTVDFNWEHLVICRKLKTGRKAAKTSIPRLVVQTVHDYSFGIFEQVTKQAAGQPFIGPCKLSKPTSTPPIRTILMMATHQLKSTTAAMWLMNMTTRTQQKVRFGAWKCW